MNVPCATSHSNASKLDAAFVDQCFVQCLLARREEKTREETTKERKRGEKKEGRREEDKERREPPELEMIDMPPAPASARPMSNFERCIALRLVATRRSHRPKNISFASYHIVPLLSHVSVVPCVVSLCCRVRWCPAQAPRQ